MAAGRGQDVDGSIRVASRARDLRRRPCRAGTAMAGDKHLDSAMGTTAVGWAMAMTMMKALVLAVAMSEMV